MQLGHHKHNQKKRKDWFLSPSTQTEDDERNKVHSLHTKLFPLFERNQVTGAGEEDKI